MGILTRYILRSHVGPFLFALSVLTGLLMVNTLARRFEELAGKGLPLSVILEFFALSLPHIVALTLPMAVLVAVLYTFSQLAAENEITAMKASGMKLARLLVPLLVVAAGLTAGMTWFNDRVLPETNHRLRNLLVDVGRKSPTLELRERVINPIQTGDLRTRYFLQAAQIDHVTSRLWDVVIYDVSEPGRDRTIYADSGRMAFNQDETDLFLTLYDGFIHEVEHQQAVTFQRLFFDQQLIRVEGVGTQLERSMSSYRSDREMSIAMLEDEVSRWELQLAEVRGQAENESQEALRVALQGRETWASPAVVAGAGGRHAVDRVADDARRLAVELRGLDAQARMLQYRINEHRVEIHKKYAIPFACIVFVLIGPALAVRIPRGGVGMVIAVSLTIFTVYYVGLIAGESLGDRGVIPPFWAMWAPNIIFLVLGIAAVARLGREEASSRGGGWVEFWQVIREAVARRWRPAPVRREVEA